MPRGAPKTREQKAADKRAYRALCRRREVCFQCKRSIKGRKAALCARCVELREAARARYDAKNPGRKRPSKAPRPPGWNALRLLKRRDVSWNKKQAQLCTASSCSDDALEDSNHCARHRDMNRKASREYQRRKAAARREHEAALRSVTEQRNAA